MFRHKCLPSLDMIARGQKFENRGYGREPRRESITRRSTFKICDATLEGGPRWIWLREYS